MYIDGLPTRLGRGGDLVALPGQINNISQSSHKLCLSAAGNRTCQVLIGSQHIHIIIARVAIQIVSFVGKIIRGIGVEQIMNIQGISKKSNREAPQGDKFLFRTMISAPPEPASDVFMVGTKNYGDGLSLGAPQPFHVAGNALQLLPIQFMILSAWQKGGDNSFIVHISRIETSIPGIELMPFHGIDAATRKG